MTLIKLKVNLPKMWKYLAGVNKPDKRKGDTKESNEIYDERNTSEHFKLTGTISSFSKVLPYYPFT